MGIKSFNNIDPNKVEHKSFSKIIQEHSIGDALHIPPEFLHTIKILEMGAIKYGANSWLNGQHFDVHKNHRSMSHHLLESYREIRPDYESGLDPLLHLACRALMEYTLRYRNRLDKNGKVKKDAGR